MTGRALGSRTSPGPSSRRPPRWWSRSGRWSSTARTCRWRPTPWSPRRSRCGRSRRWVATTCSSRPSWRTARAASTSTSRGPSRSGPRRCRASWSSWCGRCAPGPPGSSSSMATAATWTPSVGRSSSWWSRATTSPGCRVRRPAPTCTPVAPRPPCCSTCVPTWCTSSAPSPGHGPPPSCCRGCGRAGSSRCRPRASSATLPGRAPRRAAPARGDGRSRRRRARAGRARVVGRAPAVGRARRDPAGLPVRVALVTGAARGIGAATVAHLAGEGYAVLALDACAGPGAAAVRHAGRGRPRRRRGRARRGRGGGGRRA